MSQSRALLTIPVIASTALFSRRFVQYDGALAESPALSPVLPLGVSRSDAAVGEIVAVDVLGTAVVLSGAPIAVGDSISPDDTGRGVPTGDGSFFAGRALSATTGADQEFELLLAIS